MKKSKEIPIEDIIFNQNEIEFEFDKYVDGEEIYEDGSLPYKDFLWFRDEYGVYGSYIDEILEELRKNNEK